MQVKFFMTPLRAVVVEEGSAVHVARRTVPVGSKGDRYPAGLRSQFFLTDVMRPAAAGFADAAAHHQQVNRATVGHVHVVPVVDPGADDDHGFATRFVRGFGKFARDADDFVRRYAGQFFLPGGGAGDVVAVVFGNVVAAQVVINAVVGKGQIKNGRHLHYAPIGECQAAAGDVAVQDFVMLAARPKFTVGKRGEVGKGDAGDVFALEA